MGWRFIIAYELGYTDSAIFSRAFKNYYDVSPREYRKEYSKNCKDSFLLSEYNKDTAKKEWAGAPFPVTELKRLKVKSVFIVGGDFVVNRSVEQAIKNLGMQTTRYCGQDRHETS